MRSQDAEVLASSLIVRECFSVVQPKGIVDSSDGALEKMTACDAFPALNDCMLQSICLQIRLQDACLSCCVRAMYDNC